jgi:hypothetical protein
MDELWDEPVAEAAAETGVGPVAENEALSPAEI